MEGIAACMTNNSFGWKFVVGFIVGVTLLFKSTVGSAASIEQNSSVRRLGDYPNFLYDCLCGHGPRPNDLYAWHFREMLYPPKRVLPVYGYPFEIRVTCQDCRIDGDTAADAHFTAGVVEVTWRRLPKSNPRQSTLADFR
jgi:hypothetical protein